MTQTSKNAPTPASTPESRLKSILCNLKGIPVIPLPTKKNTLKAHYIEQAWREAKEELQHAAATLAQHFQSWQLYAPARRANELHDQIHLFGTAVFPYDLIHAYQQLFDLTDSPAASTSHLHLFWKHMALFGKALLTANNP